MRSRYVPRRYFYRRRATPAFSLTQVLILGAGVVLLALGILAMARAGLSRPLDQPLVDVFGYPQTALLGVFETIAGVVLIAASFGNVSRRSAALLGIGLVVVGVLFLADLSWFHAHLSPDSSFGWVPVVTGGVVVGSFVL